MTAQGATRPAGGGAGKPAQGRDDGPDRKPAPLQKPQPRTPEPPKPGFAPNGMRIVTKR